MIVCVFNLAAAVANAAAAVCSYQPSNQTTMWCFIGATAAHTIAAVLNWMTYVAVREARP